MVDRDTMAAYAANIDKYRNLVTKIGGNSGWTVFWHGFPKPRSLTWAAGSATARCGCAMPGSPCPADASPDMVATAMIFTGWTPYETSASCRKTRPMTPSGRASACFTPRAPRCRQILSNPSGHPPGGLFYMGLKLGAGGARDAAGRFYAYFSEEEREMLAEAGFSVLAAELIQWSACLAARPCIHITSARD